MTTVGLPPSAARRVPLTSWFRFRRAVENTATVLLVLELFRQKELKTQATAAFVLIPFVLRALMLV